MQMYAYKQGKVKIPINCLACNEVSIEYAVT